MTVYECDLSLENRAAIEGLHMVEEALAEYTPITMFEECFTEAFGGKKKKEEEAKRAAEIKAKEEANAKATAKGTSGLKKAIDAVLAMCRKIIEAIDNFFQEHALDKEEKEAYEAFKAACKQDPSLANKKITVRDFRKTFDEYKKLMAECEKEMEACAKDADHPTESIFKKIESFVKDNAKGVAVSLAASAAINVSSVDRQFAKYIRATMHSDERILKGMQDAMGKKEFKKMDRGIRSLSHRFSIKRKIMSMTNNLYKDVTSGILAPIFDLKNMGKRFIKGETLGDKIGDPRQNGGEVQIANLLLKNKSTGKTIKTAGKMGAKVGWYGAVGGAKDKIVYMGKKVIMPKTMEARGLYGNTLAGAAADQVKSSLHPVGKTGERPKK